MGSIKVSIDLNTNNIEKAAEQAQYKSPLITSITLNVTSLTSQQVILSLHVFVCSLPFFFEV